MRIMITGGGTGGHTSPALAVVEELQRRDRRLELQWVGRAGGIEERVCKKHAIPFRALPVEGWPRRLNARKLIVGAKMAWAVLRGRMLIKKFQPQLVFGVGGYVSLPLVWAAQRVHVPTFLHEQNRLLGMANRVLAPRATRIFLSYSDTMGQYPKDRAAVVGNPVRGVFAHPPEKKAARATLGLDEQTPVVLVSGGSQGAHSLNEAVAGALGQFRRDEVQFLWMAGPTGAAQARSIAETAPVRVDVFPFIDDMVSACAAADIVVSRSGASTTAELALLGKPSILVPYPHATDNHQEQNALAFQMAGAAILIRDSECDGDRLARVLRELLGEPARLQAMGSAASTLARPGAAEAIVDEIMNLVFESA